MSAAASNVSALDGGRSERVRLALQLTALAIAALAISGFTVLRRIDGLDEGVMLQAVERIVAGQVPYRDFLWPYGPTQPYLLTLFHAIDGPSLLDWRLVRVVGDCAISLTAFLLVRSFAGTRWALAAWLVAILSVSEPASANPFSFAVLASLLALAAASTVVRADNPLRRAALAGLLCGVAASWRPDAGFFAMIAVTAALLAAESIDRLKRVAVAILGGALTAAVVYLPFAAASSPAGLYDALVGKALRDAEAWRLPFVWISDLPVRSSSVGPFTSDLNDVLADQVPLLLLIALATAALLIAVTWRGNHASRPLATGLFVLGLGYSYYMVSRPDAHHLQPLAVVVAILAPLLVGVWWRGGVRSRSLAALALCLIACWGLVGAEALGDRLSALFRPPALERVDLAVADGVRATPREARSLPVIAAAVQRLTKPGQPIFVMPAPANPLRVTAPVLYVLMQRPNPRRADLELEQLPAVQRQTAEVLGRTKPRVVIRWTDLQPDWVEPKFPAISNKSELVDRYIDRQYRREIVSGPYEVLVLRR